MKKRAQLLFYGLAIFLLTIKGAGAGFFDDDETIWKSAEQYIKLEEQSKFKGKATPPNDHPVELISKDITDALLSIRFWSKDRKNDNEADRLFSSRQAAMLGVQLVKGLAAAKPDQDITFALIRYVNLALGLVKDRAYYAGRFFYKDGKLNILLGDFNRLPDRAQEVVRTTVNLDNDDNFYFFDTGSRAKHHKLKIHFITDDGVEIYEDANGKRQDWVIVDVEKAAIAYRQSRRNPKEANDDIDSAELRAEQARLSKERREMRAEMARMRKEMQKISGSESGNASSSSIEERIATLDQLYEKELISEEEYIARRKIILDDI